MANGDSVSGFRPQDLRHGHGEEHPVSMRPDQLMSNDFARMSSSNFSERRFTMPNRESQQSQQLRDQFLKSEQSKAGGGVAVASEQFSSIPKLDELKFVPVPNLERQESALPSQNLHQVSEFVDKNEGQFEDQCKGDFNPPKKKTFFQRLKQMGKPKNLLILGGAGLIALALVGTVVSGGLVPAVIVASYMACYGAIAVGVCCLGKNFLKSLDFGQQTPTPYDSSSNPRMNEYHLNEAYNQGFLEGREEHFDAGWHKGREAGFQEALQQDRKSLDGEVNYHDKQYEQRQFFQNQRDEDDSARRLQEKHRHQVHVS